MNLFLDTEFTGLHQYTKLISIGLIDEQDNSFYAETCDFMTGYANDEDCEWAKTNIIPHLKFYGKKDKGYNNAHLSANKTEVFGEIDLIRHSLEVWLDECEHEKQEIWSDCLAYDWVLFNQLFGHAFNIPRSVYYIPFDLATAMKIKGIDPDINREEFAGMTEGSEKHNALWDAKVIRACYQKLQTI